MRSIIKYLPFVGIIAINSLAVAGRYRLENLKPYILAISAVVLINFIIAIIAKVKSYFVYGVSGIVIIGVISVYYWPSLGQIYLENAIAGLYVGLFLVAMLPPLFKLDPFTYEFSKKNYPEAITKTDQFRKINIIINYIWAALFGICIILSTIKYSDDGGIQVIVSSIVPIVLLLSVGIPVNIKMKNFLDRILPNIKPYMLIEAGETRHPHRYPEDKQQGFVVFSAAGFPEVEHNFDGLKGMFRCIHSHSEKSFLMGEFFMPGAELISQPVYAERRMKVEEACYNAGEQVVKEGKINTEFMQAVSDVGIAQKKFQEQADYFWESLDGKASYLKSFPKLEYNNNI